MKIVRLDTPFPALSIDDFMPTPSLIRAASISFETVKNEDWVKYSGEAGQVQYCSKAPRQSTPAALLVLDYIASFFDPNTAFENLTSNVFPDTSHYGGGMMMTPNSKGEGGYLGMHVDADVHALNLNWKREYSAVLCISEEYDSSFDLLMHDGKETHARLPYKFNRLNVFKCTPRSWHGLPQITMGLDRKTLGVMYWSLMTEKDKSTARIKAKFKDDLEWK